MAGVNFSLTRQGHPLTVACLHIKWELEPQLPGIAEFRTWERQAETTCRCVLSAAERGGSPLSGMGDSQCDCRKGTAQSKGYVSTQTVVKGNRQLYWDEILASMPFY